MNTRRKRILSLLSFVVLIGATFSHATAQRTRFTVFARKLKIANASNKTLHVELRFVTGGVDTVKVEPGKTNVYFWHRGIYNIEKIGVTHEPGSHWGSEKWKVFEVPTDWQGHFRYNLEYRGADDVTYSVSVL